MKLRLRWVFWSVSVAWYCGLSMPRRAVAFVDVFGRRSEHAVEADPRLGQAEVLGQQLVAGVQEGVQVALRASPEQAVASANLAVRHILLDLGASAVRSVAAALGQGR